MAAFQVITEENRASLFSVEALDYCRDSGKRFRASRIRNTDDFVLGISGCRGGMVRGDHENTVRPVTLGVSWV
jgi:hypothetical protein